MTRDLENDIQIQVRGGGSRARVAILTSDKRHFKIKTVTKDTEGHYIMIKGSIL